MNKINILLFCLFICLLTACKTTKYIEVPVITEKTHTEQILKHDSVYIQDSVFVNQYVKGDTVFRDKEKIKLVRVAKHDTITKCDTIPKIIKVREVQQVKYVPDYYKTINWLFWIIVIFIVGIIVIKIKFKR